MDNLNDKPSPMKDELDAENQKWLEDLLNTSEKPEKPVTEVKPAATVEEPATKPATELPAEPISKESLDEQVERILAEDWLKTTEPFEPEKHTQPEIPEDPERKELLKDMPEEPVVPDQPQEEPEDTPKQKIRPKRKSGYGMLGIPHILSTVIWLALIVAIGVSFGRVLWVCCADVMAFGKENRSVTITITADDDINDIAKKLGDAQLVRYPGLFKLFATLTGKDDNIHVGTFTLNARLDYNAMINAMFNYSPQRKTVEIMFPEGYNCAQVFKLLAEKNVCTVEDLENYAANGELSDYWFLEGVPRGDKYCLEGYLAPDTYKFYVDDSPRRVLEKFLDEFDDRFTDLMKKDFEKIQKTYEDRLRAKGFGAAYIAENKLTLHRVVTLASIIQKETSSNAECYEISSVFYNRLVNPDILTLGADATVYYALGDYFWEIKELTAEHLEVDSPYNTRKNTGIPPGPICNMGVHALYAALEPNESNNHYFVYDPKRGYHRFAVTYSEHLKNIAEVEAQ